MSYSANKPSGKVKHERNIYRGRPINSRPIKECSSCNKKLSAAVKKRVGNRAEVVKRKEKVDKRNRPLHFEGSLEKQIINKQSKSAWESDKQTVLVNKKDEKEIPCGKNKEDDLTLFLQKVFGWVDY